MNIKNQDNSGFTLIELLVVTAIIGLLSSIIFSVSSIARAKGRDGRRLGDIDAIITALGLEYASNGHFPCHSGYDSTVLMSDPTQPNPDFLKQLKTDGLLRNIPIYDPVNKDPLIYGYQTYNTYTGGSQTKAACGASALIWFSTETNQKACPANGILYGGTHCHIFIYTGPSNCVYNGHAWNDPNMALADVSVWSCSQSDPYAFNDY
jgi:prepilin-type N-terminal cleavage/methylation domain-containing protein